MSKFIEWYRPNPLFKLIRLGLISGSVMIFGVLVMALGIDSTPFSFVSNTEAWIGFGMALVVLGVSATVYGVYRIHSKGEIYLQLDRKGLLYVHENNRVDISWQSISDISIVEKKIRVKHDGENSIDIEGRFIGIDQKSLCSRLNEVKRNTLLGIKSP